jgi:hypothetical protein
MQQLSGSYAAAIWKLCSSYLKAMQQQHKRHLLLRSLVQLCQQTHHKSSVTLPLQTWPFRFQKLFSQVTKQWKQVDKRLWSQQKRKRTFLSSFLLYISTNFLSFLDFFFGKHRKNNLKINLDF